MESTGMKAWILLLVPSLVAAQSLMLLGGAIKENNTAIWSQMIRLAGGRGVAKIGIISTEDTMTRECESMLTNFNVVYGAASVVHVPVTADNNNEPATAQLIRNQTGILILDSSHNRLSLIETLRPNGNDSLALTAVRNALRSGAVVAGDGSFMSNAVVIVGGTTWGALMMGSLATNAHATATVAADETNSVKLNYSPQGGLGLFSDSYVVDTRFSELGREGRLIRLLQDTRHLPVIGATRGIGIDEDTALVVTNSLTKPVAKVIGFSGGVFYVDVNSLQSSSHTNGTFSFDNLPVSFLSLDDTMDLTTNEVRYADWKSALAGVEWFKKAKPSTDIFSDETGGRWRYAAKRLVDCQDDFVITNYSIETFKPQFQVVFDRGQCVAYGSDISNTTTFVASYRNLLVSIKALPIAD